MGNLNELTTETYSRLRKSLNYRFLKSTDIQLKLTLEIKENNFLYLYLNNIDSYNKKIELENKQTLSIPKSEEILRIELNNGIFSQTEKELVIDTIDNKITNYEHINVIGNTPDDCKDSIRKATVSIENLNEINSILHEEEQLIIPEIYSTLSKPKKNLRELLAQKDNISYLFK